VIEISRYILAIAVAQTHLWPRGQNWTGQIAVFAFYTLSGYLMTRVLNARYGFTWGGTGRFILNRILRLWPAYSAIMALALLALHFLPLWNFFPLIQLPQSLAEIVTNAVVLGQVTFDFRQWLPMAKPLVTSWSLSVEICSYLLLAIYFARSPTRLYVFIILGLLGMAASTAWCAFSPDPAAYGPYCFQQRYGVIQAGFVPFACGGLFYFHKKRVDAWLQAHWRLAIGILGAAILLMFSGPMLSATIGPFLGIPVACFLLSAAPEARATPVQDFFGRASYHVFIAHMPIAATLVVGLHFRADSLAVFLTTLVIALVLSGALVPLEWRINAVRRQIAPLNKVR
jgi:peptidoglycan/LPS O-acetylase OafA/YrhL